MVQKQFPACIRANLFLQMVTVPPSLLRENSSELNQRKEQVSEITFLPFPSLSPF